MSSKRVTATDRVRDEIDGLFADRDRDLAEVLEEVARLSVRLVMQSALEAEVTEFLGRERYARGQRSREGMRNGYSPTTVKTTAGAVTLERPKVRGTLESFSSRLLGKHVTRAGALESLVISGWVRGLSDRDIEAALAEALGPEAAVSRSTVSRIGERITDEFAQWKRRDLTDVELDYLFVDASHFGDRRRRPQRAGAGRLPPSPPPAARCSSTQTGSRRSPPTPVSASSRTCSPAGCPRRC